MARNKYPEKTRQKILDVSKKLFLAKGYDNTTLQDIINELDGLTKGVIYHHFKSKKDIFDSIMSQLSGETEEKNWYDDWDGENGFDKIQKLLIRELTNFEKHSIVFSSKVMSNDPKMIGERYLESIKEVVPIMNKYVEEGVMDGSIVTDFPEECTELLVLVINMWIGLEMMNFTIVQFERKCRFIKQLFENLNVPIFNDAILNDAVVLRKYLEKIDIASE